VIGTRTSGSAARRRHAIQRNHALVPVLFDSPDNEFAAWQFPTLVPVGIDDPIIHSHIKDTPVSLFQLRLYAELLFNFSRQTGSPIMETSLNTIGNFDTQALLLFVLIFHFPPPFKFP
jgi:hypothetical protein